MSATQTSIRWSRFCRSSSPSWTLTAVTRESVSSPTPTTWLPPSNWTITRMSATFRRTSTGSFTRQAIRTGTHTLRWNMCVKTCCRRRSVIATTYRTWSLFYIPVYRTTRGAHRSVYTLGGIYNYDSTSIPFRFDNLSRAVRRAFGYQRSLRSQWHYTSHWPASHAELFIYLGLSATDHAQVGLQLRLDRRSTPTRLQFTSRHHDVWSNFVPKTHLFWDIRLQSENGVMGPTRSLEMSPFDRAHMTSYWRSMVPWLYLVSFLRYSISKNIATLKSQSRINQGHWKWYLSY